ncbi:hypothetical protein F4818DRAFT_422534 [Hypoxylon cercidicola]|nr:hypothetical protein F4818DRAFT_422534 [Hypoxylon cercidicola]
MEFTQLYVSIPSYLFNITTPIRGPKGAEQNLLSGKANMAMSMDLESLSTNYTHVLYQQSPGEMEVAQALETARESPDGLCDLSTFNTISAAYQAIWSKIRENPQSYTMTMGEFAVFNFFQHLHKGQHDVEVMAREATARFWTYAHAPDYRQ